MPADKAKGVKPLQYLRTERADLDALSYYPGNARVHDMASLDESVRTNGQYRSVVARELDDGKLQILAGHGTADALRRKGNTHARVEVIRADDTEARRIVLADNGTTRHATYDDRLLLALLDDAQRDGGLAGTGWDADAFTDVLAASGDLPTLEQLEDQYGDVDERALWPVIRLAVPHETRVAYLALMEHDALGPDADEHERFAALVAAAERGLR